MTLTVIEKTCSCGLRIWEFSNGRDLLAFTPIDHLPHPAEDDILAGADWYIVTTEMIADFHAAFHDCVTAVPA